MDSSNYFLLSTDFFPSVSSQKTAILFTAICLREATNLTEVHGEHTLLRVVGYFPVITLVLSAPNLRQITQKSPPISLSLPDRYEVVQRTMLMVESVA